MKKHKPDKSAVFNTTLYFVFLYILKHIKYALDHKSPSIIHYLPIFSFRTLSSSSKLSLSLNAFMLCSEEAPTRLPYLISNEQNSIFSLSSFSSIFNLSIASPVLPVTLCPSGPPVRHNNLLFCLFCIYCIIHLYYKLFNMPDFIL